MRLAPHAEAFCLGSVPMVGNRVTGGLIGLTPEGRALCDELSTRDVAPSEVPESCRELAEHLARGGYLEDGEKDLDGSVPQVMSAYLHITQRCNLSCRFCYSKDAGRNALPDPSLPELARALDLLGGLGAQRIVISGGEPFLRDDLARLAERAREAGIGEVIVLTNGLLVTDEAVAALAGLASCIAVAFDGPDERSVPHLRGERRAARLVEAVRAVRDAGIEARVLPTLHGRNLEDQDAYRELARELGASLGFSLLTAPIAELGDYAIGEDDLAELGRSVADGKGGCGDDLLGPGVALAARATCGAGVRTLSVAADGTVYPCHMLHDPALTLGNAFTDPAEKIMGGAVARRFRSLDARMFDGCGSCDKRVLCGGGCRARAYLSGLGLEGRDPYCELSRSYYARLGDLLEQRFMPKGGGQDAV